MKTTITKTFDEDEQSQERIFSSSMSMYMCLSDLADYLRTLDKYNPENYNEDQCKVVEKIRERFYNILNEEGINLDSLG